MASKKHDRNLFDNRLKNSEMIPQPPRRPIEPPKQADIPFNKDDVIFEMPNQQPAPEPKEEEPNWWRSLLG